MTRRTCASVIATLGAVLLVGSFSHFHRTYAAAGVHSDYTAPDCDRKCLYGFVDQYLAALVAKDPSRLPWGSTVKFTENNVELKVGDGLWGTVSGLGPEDLRAADPENG